METLQARREWKAIFQVMKTKGLQPRLLYPARLSNKMEGEIRSFSDKKRLNEYTSTKQALQDMLGEILKKSKKKSKRERHTGTRDKMAMNKYLLIMTLNINGLNVPIKRHRVGEWVRKHDLQICCLQKTHLRTKDLHRLKVKV